MKASIEGCQPVEKPCNPVVLLQLSKNNKAEQCYCNGNDCNNPTDYFKLYVGGYLVIIIGTLGITGNTLAFGTLWSLNKKDDVDVILTGMFKGVPSKYAIRDPIPRPWLHQFCKFDVSCHI